MTTRKRYVVSFFKKVATDIGDVHDIRQHEIEVFAADKSDALKQAKDELCQLEGLSDWALHADRFEVAEPDLPS